MTTEFPVTRGGRRRTRWYLPRVEPTEALNAVEVALRDLIVQVLEPKLGSKWLEQCVTPERLETWRKRMEEESKKRDGTVTDDRLIAFADFTDLAPIVRKHWEAFKPCLGDKKTFEVYMARLEDFRNAPMHSRVLVPFELALLEGMTGEIRNKVTLYRTKDSTDRFFPRIESVRDSFGRSGADDSARGPVILHPGDQVVFECVGWDPDNRPLEWSGFVTPSYADCGEPVRGQHVRLTWDVNETDIAEQVVVMVRVVSDRPYHRNGNTDDDVVFRYSVLPRAPTT